MKVGCNGMIKELPVFSKTTKVIIGEGAWIGLNSAIILCKVGQHAFVSAYTILKKI